MKAYDIEVTTDGSYKITIAQSLDIVPKSVMVILPFQAKSLARMILSAANNPKRHKRKSVKNTSWTQR
jgi:ATP-dependent protease ClpP protease subunit